MKIIDKKNFFPTVCVSYTILSISKIIIEGFALDKFGNEQENFLVMFFLSCISTFVLSQHYRLQRLPFFLVVLGQYLLLVSIAMGIIWISGNYNQLHENSYRDMFCSFTVTYLIGATVYYLNVFLEVKRANSRLEDIKKKGV